MERPCAIQSLATLPLEIQFTIASFMTACDSWRCAAVNRSWRSLFLSSDCMWETLSTKSKHNIVPELLQYHQYIRRSAVKTLHVGVKDSCHLQDIIDFLNSIPCRSVKQVYLNAPRLSSTTLLGFMNNSSATLAYMHVSLYDTGASNVTPDTMLRHCPNLKALYFIGFIDNSQKTDGSWRPALDFKHQNLLNLLLDYQGSLHGNFDMRPFLEALPKLRKLCLTFEDIENSGLPTEDLQKCAPELSDLTLVPGNFDVPAETLDFNPLSCEGNGLERLSVTVYETSPAFQTLIQDIARTQQRSLSNLELDGDESLSLPLLLAISGNVFDWLVRLTLSNASEGDPLALCAILLRSCPSLMYLGLHCLEFANDDVLSACLGPDCLQELDIRECPEITSGALASVLRWMGRHGLIYHLNLFYMGSVTSAVMDAISSLEYLEYLSLAGCPSVTADDFERFLDTTQSKRKFTNITFTSSMDPDLDSVTDSETVQRIFHKLDTKAEKWRFGRAIRSESGVKN